VTSFSYVVCACRLYETFDEGSDFYIVTELVEGGELFDRIVSKAHYTEKEARDLIKSLLETLNYMHTTGVVHRDLKPENLLLCSGESCCWCHVRMLQSRRAATMSSFCRSLTAVACCRLVDFSLTFPSSAVASLFPSRRIR
jgi:serine/threonine protein kinase